MLVQHVVRQQNYKTSPLFFNRFNYQRSFSEMAAYVSQYCHGWSIPNTEMCVFITCFHPPPSIDLVFRMLISQEGDVWCSPVGFAHSGPASRSCQPLYCRWSLFFLCYRVASVHLAAEVVWNRNMLKVVCFLFNAFWRRRFCHVATRVLRSGLCAAVSSDQKARSSPIKAGISCLSKKEKFDWRGRRLLQSLPSSASKNTARL